MRERIIYKKSGGGFLTIESEVESEDADFLYMSCGKYLLDNIVRRYYIAEQKERKKDLKDDA